ncbi:hypothetical protein N431DRAFT_487684 [Stipitochalara longipes BDJ]|nr:hypothetical protein N431DRAFT_487684 [Stipitochalara longipes BDJ]
MVYRNLQNGALAITLLCPVLSSTMVVLRFYSRKVSSYLGADDWVMLAAMAIALAQTVTTWGGNYIGIHVWDIPPNAYASTVPAKYLWANEVLYNPILALVKASVLIFLNRLGSSIWGLHFTTWVIFCVNLAQMIAIFLTTIFQCIPVARFWDPTIPGGHCIQSSSFYGAGAGITILTDIMVLALPIWIVSRLKNVTMRTRVAIWAILSLGVLVTAISCIRVWAFVKIFLEPPQPDPTYNLLFCISTIEVHCAIIVACTPALKPLFGKWFGAKHKRPDRFARAAGNPAQNHLEDGSGESTSQSCSRNSTNLS